jgi:predicted AlkP superfamily pyrophosphatase or phosphodiesterase
MAAMLPIRPSQPGAPIVILISIDGWRWDYLDRVNAPTLKVLAADGVRSEGLIPSFPSVTFPNHYTIVTGLLPDHHGIIANAMLDRSIGPDKFTMAAPTARDPRWWGGEPIWTTVMRHGGRSAAMFWPGSEAIHPTYWRPFDDTLPNAERVKQVLAWLALPEGERPSFNTIYFSDVDHAGHDFGPDAAETAAAAARVDAAIGSLVQGVRALGLEPRTTYVVVSDHGMAATSESRLIYLDDYVGPDDVEVVDTTPNAEMNPKSTLSADAIYKRLVNAHPALAVYRRADLPAWLHYGTNPRIPAVLALADLGWTITSHTAAEARHAQGRSFNGGAHGYDPRYREMHGLFVAAGPRLRRGVVLPEFRNVDIYGLLCELLQVAPAPNDGDLREIERALNR